MTTVKPRGFKGWIFIAAVFATLQGVAQQTPPVVRLDLVARGLVRPVFVAAPPGDSARLFILEQHSGRIRILQRSTGALLAVDYLRLTGLTTGNEQGLLGLAFHPGFATNGFFFVNYTTTGGRTEVTRYTAQGDPMTSNVANAATKKVLLIITQPESNHNGGWMGFGPDGFLYVASGDGGGGNDQHGTSGNSQNRLNLLGKILRIDVDNGALYDIPQGNPYKGHATFRQEIWAFGLRNPWRCAFDRATGDLWIGDVGQGAREEIDVIPAGVADLNFGWRPREGFIATSGISPSEQPVTAATNPVHDYSRSLGVSVTGGVVYRGSALPHLAGRYFFADYGSARLWSFKLVNGVRTDLLEHTSDSNVRTVLGTPSSFGEDAEGEVYVCDHSGGEVFQFAATAPTAPALELEGHDLANGTLTLGFGVRPGFSYVLESAGSLDAPAWTTARTFSTPTLLGRLSATVTPSGGEVYYRVVAR